MLSTFNEGMLFGERRGTEPLAVLLLHGWGRSHGDYDRVAPALGLPSIALDLPGFGATPQPSRGWSSRDYAEAVLPVLDEAEAPVIVVGHSHGGRVALELATIAPQRIAGLVLIGAPLLRPALSPTPSLSYRILRWLHARHLYSDEAMERRRRNSGSADYRNASGVMRETLVTVVNESFEKELAALRCPVRLLWGEQDRDVPVALAQSIETVLSSSDVSLTVIPGVGHLVPTTAPESVVEAVRSLSS